MISNKLTRFFKTIGVIFISLLLSLQIQAQEAPDTLDVPTDSVLREKHSPVRASIYSMVIPGLGQAYNQKYWKIPLVYAGIGVPLYFALEEHQDFKDYRSAYRNRLAGDSSDTYTELSNENLLDFIDVKRRNRDLLLIISSVVYVLNIVDASVDAHFFYFDVSEDLSLQINPTLSPMNMAQRREYTPGVRLTLHFN